jgi:4-amino-4-deoxy-L-arabinose transferase-like glycosyltransferase
VLFTLAAAGALQALSYNAIATDDAIRYWAVADGLRSGAGYPVTTGAAGGQGFYLIELPIYPLLIAGSFALVGHRFAALQLPLIAANLVLPWLFYLTGRELGLSRMAALWLSLALLCLPFYQSYALGTSQPEPLLAAWLALALWLVARTCVRPAMPFASRPAPLAPGNADYGPSSGSRRPGSERSRAPALGYWLALGLAAAGAVLTRPEGALYAGPLFAGLAWHYRRDLASGAGRRLLLAALCCAVPVAAFSLFLRARFGIFWPAGWTNVAGPQYLAANVELVLRRDLPHYAAVLGLPETRLSGQVLAAAVLAVVGLGLVRMWCAWPALRFIPAALALNLGVIFLSPTYLTPDLFTPQTFFRHLSVLLPWLLPALTTLLSREGPGARENAGSQAAHALALRLPAVPLRPSWLHRRAGLPEAVQTAIRAAWGLAAAGLLLGELAVLGASTSQVMSRRPSVLSPELYLLITDLWRSDDRLPLLPFVTDDRGITSVDPRFDYMAFRTSFFAAISAGDLHVNDAGRAYVLACAVVALGGLGALALAQRAPRPDAASRSQPAC